MSNETLNIEPVVVEVVTAELDKVNTTAGIGDESAIELRGKFGTFYNDIVSWRKQAAAITDPANPEQQAIARTVRLGLRRVRCDVETVRKTLKAEYLSGGRAVDGYANVLKHLTEPIEAKLMDVEKYAERQEEARIAVLVTERTTKLVEVDADPTAYNLGAMDEETWAIVLAGATKKRDDRIEAERVAEAERVKAEAEAAAERERVQAENEKLKAEAAEKEKALAVEREAAAAKQAEVEAKAKAEREAAAIKQAEIEAKAADERREREKLERKAALEKEKRDAEAAAKAEAEAAAARAPDRDKISAMATKMRAATLPDMATDEGKAAMVKIASQREKFAAWIDGIAKGL